MRLKQHLDLIQDILYSRQEISIETFLLQETVPGREGIIEGRLRFWDRGIAYSLLPIEIWQLLPENMLKHVNIIQ